MPTRPATSTHPLFPRPRSLAAGVRAGWRQLGEMAGEAVYVRADGTLALEKDHDRLVEMTAAERWRFRATWHEAAGAPRGDQPPSTVRPGFGAPPC